MIAARGDLAAQDGWFAEMYGNPGARMATADELVAEMGRCGVDLSVASGFAFASLDLCITGNDYVAASCRRFPDRIIGFTVIPPLHPGALEELERCRKLGFKGIGELLPDGQGFDLGDTESLGGMAAWAVANRQPVLVHLSEPMGRSYPGKGQVTPDKGCRLARHYPDLKLVFAHWGGGLPFFELMPDVRGALANVYYDCAASPYLYDPDIYRTVAGLAGSGRVIFGTDYPLLSPERYLKEIGEQGLGPDTYSAFMGRNAAGLLGLEAMEEEAAGRGRA